MNSINYIFFFIIIISIVYYKLNDIDSIIDENIEESYLNYKKVGNDLGYKLEIPTVKLITLSTSNKNTIYYKFGNILSNFLPTNNMLSEGSIDNLNKLKTNRVEFALCQEEIAHDAYFGRNDFSNKSIKNITFVTGLFFEYGVLISNSNLPIKKMIDLKDGFSKINRNYIIGFPNSPSGSYYIGNKLLKLLDISPYKLGSKNNGNNKIYYQQYDINQLIYQFVTNKLDCIFLMTSTNNPYITNLCKIKSVTFVPIELPNTDILKSYINPIYFKNYNPGDFFSKNYTSEQIPSIASRCILLSRNNVEKNVVKHVTKTIFDNNIDIKHTLDNFIYSKYSNTFIDSFIHSKMVYIDKLFPIHDGSLELFKELGYITNNPNLKCEYSDVGIDCNPSIDIKKYYWKYPEKQWPLQSN